MDGRHLSAPGHRLDPDNVGEMPEPPFPGTGDPQLQQIITETLRRFRDGEEPAAVAFAAALGWRGARPRVNALAAPPRVTTTQAPVRCVKAARTSASSSMSDGDRMDDQQRAERRERERQRKLEQRQRSGVLGAYCMICGEGPFVYVAQHSRQMHGVGRNAYRRMFRDADHTHADLKAAMTLEAIDKGYKPGKPPRRKVCKRGHPLRGANVRVRPDGSRRCRRCEWEVTEAFRAARRAAVGTKPCECGCGTAIPALRHDGKPSRFVPGHNFRLMRRDPASGRLLPEVFGA
jgi:hypothetical protein